MARTEEHRPNLRLPVFLERRKNNVEEVVALDRKDFLVWLRDRKDSKQFTFSDGALRYLFIPERYLEIADDPTKVETVRLGYCNNNNTNVMVVERKKSPITELGVFEDFLNLSWQEQARLIEESDEKKLDQILLPSGKVDKFHALLLSCILRHQIDLNDQVILVIKLSFSLDCLNVSSYDDRHELRSRGIAKSFYERLHETAKIMRYRFITGQNNPDNISFFTKCLGRYPLSRIKKSAWSIMGFDYQISDVESQYITVDFLRDQDKREFLQPV